MGEMHSDRRAFLAACAGVFAASLRPGRSEEIAFRDVRGQTRQFMRWYEEISLTPAQEDVKKEALGSIPAPCCSDNSAYTCCCPCNISRTIWGLSQYMIARQDASASQVRDKVREWISFVGPRPPRAFSGSGCYTGHCSRPFREGGCGGMSPEALAF